MKRILSIAGITLLAIFLVACGSKQQAARPETIQVTVTVTPLGQTGQTQKLNAQFGQKLMDLMTSAYDIKEKSGLIMSIDGVAQDADKGIYWMYEVNHQMATVGAADYELKDGDVIHFYQSK